MIKDVRFRSEKYTKKIISKDLYKKWIKEFPEYAKYSYKDFRNFWQLIAEKYIEEVTINPNGVKLNFNFGEIALKYTTSKELNKNYNSSKITEKPVGHLNFSSSGKNGKIVWSVTYARKINIELPLLAFQACRKFTTKAAKAFLETPELFKIAKATKNNVRSIINKYIKNDN